MKATPNIPSHISLVPSRQRHGNHLLDSSTFSPYIWSQEDSFLPLGTRIMSSNQDVPLPFTSSRPLPSRQPTTSRPGGTLKRNKTLTRPERHVAPAPLVAPPTQSFSPTSPLPQSEGFLNIDWWRLWAYATTFWAPPVLLRWFGIKEKQSRQAWREKIALCWIAVLLGGVVGFVTMGLQRALCPADQQNQSMYQRLGDTNSKSTYLCGLSTS